MTKIDQAASAAPSSDGSPATNATSPPAEIKSPVSVLIVDDEMDLRTLIRLALERSPDFTVAGEARDGREAIDLAAELRPDVVLLDLNMPEVDGRKALPVILARSPRSMIVVLSALQAQVEKGPALSAGAFAYVEKTELTSDLAGRLTTLLLNFRRALEGETVVAPSAMLHMTTTITQHSATATMTDGTPDGGDDGNES